MITLGFAYIPLLLHDIYSLPLSTQLVPAHVITSNPDSPDSPDNLDDEVVDLIAPGNHNNLNNPDDNGDTNVEISKMKEPSLVARGHPVDKHERDTTVVDGSWACGAMLSEALALLLQI